MNEDVSVSRPLLGPNDPPPVEIVNDGGGARLVLLCDHASNVIPEALEGLGLDDEHLSRHIAWDNGAAAVTRRLSGRFDAPAVMSGYSRLVVDCNRVLGHETSIVQESDGTIVPGNLHLTPDEAERRIDAVFRPYHAAATRIVADRLARGIVPAVIAVHSFTDEMGGVWRPWEVSVLWDRDGRIALPLIEQLRQNADLTVGDNQPYSGREHYGYSIETHATENGLANALIEIREDQVRDDKGIERMSRIIGDALEAVLEDPAIYHVERP